MNEKAESIVVIIAAYNSEATIGRAIKSALSQSEVAEVLVVDDASTDSTVQTASLAGNGDPRLRVMQQEKNCGPSAARNRAIKESTSPIIAILDADDLFLANRLRPILSVDDWDICADNLVFFSDPVEIEQFDPETHDALRSPSPLTLDLAHFILGNISQKGRVRGELGFLKPLIRRDFLENHRLSYDESCRLGEDFILYAHALGLGAKMKVVTACGYAAQVRQDSLSSNHRVTDLQTLHQLSQRLCKTLNLSGQDLECLQLHARSVKRKLVHREVLEIRDSKSVFAGILKAILNPTALTDILSDRFSKPQPKKVTPRLLLTTQDSALHFK